MPKSKVRKKVATATSTKSTQDNVAAAAATRAQLAAPTGPVYLGIMLGLMVLGLLWLLGYYLLQSRVTFIAELGSWNFAIGFSLIIAGLLMTMRWR